MDHEADAGDQVNWVLRVQNQMHIKIDQAKVAAKQYLWSAVAQ